MIRTAWIGGSYEAATRQTITDLPPTAISRRHAEPGMGADVPLLKLIQAMPGASTHALLERLPGVKKETASRALIKMRSKRLIHSVKIAIAGRKPGNLWYPGPAPVTINHMTVGRPRTGVQPLTASNAAPPPSNAPSAGTATVEDGTIAKLMLAAMKETP